MILLVLACADETRVGVVDLTEQVVPALLERINPTEIPANRAGP